MSRRIVECVANFSEGRRPEVVRAIENSIGHLLIHSTSDADHNRSVLTFAGEPEEVREAAVRGVAKAVELVDLNAHTGAHPRLGAADVVPFVPVKKSSLIECIFLAHAAGHEIWRKTGVPVYFYEAAALRPERVRLEQVRAGEFEGVRRCVLTDVARRPDVGGPELHPTAGAAIVGARRFLIAYNVNLHSTDLTAARGIARAVRESSGGLPAVKALGLPLPGRRQVQVSVNLTNFEVTPLRAVFDAICAEAASRRIEVAGSELIGLIPQAALEPGPEYFRFENFDPSMVLENRLAAKL